MTQPPTSTARPVRRLRLGHSPDSDDAFMFYALASGAVSAADVRFDTVHQDIQTLNRLALHGELEITALSAHAYAHVWHHYALFTHGASMGQQYGPVVVAPEPLELDALHGQRIAIPGFLTSAYLALRLRLASFEPVFMPFDRIMAAVAAGDVPAGLLIHEGQLTHGSLGLHPVSDLGVWWHEETGLPLPLGVNAIRRDLGPELARSGLGTAQGEHSVRPRPPRRGAGLRDGVRRGRATRPHRPVRLDVRQRPHPGPRPGGARQRGAIPTTRLRSRHHPRPATGRVDSLTTAGAKGAGASTSQAPQA